MKKFSVSNFFEIASFEHQKLWEEDFAFYPLLSMEKYLKSVSFAIKVKLPQQIFLENEEEISIGEGTIIEKGAYIKGPCVIGKNCIIRHGSYLRGNVITGDFCVIGHCSEVKNSVLLNHAAAPHFSYVGDSILGNDVNLGAGVKCANFRLDKKEIVVEADGRSFSFDKLGAIIGDGSQIGCNSVLSPGVFLCKNVFCYPNLTIKGYIEERGIVKPVSFGKKTFNNLS